MNDEIKALKERINKLESVIVYLICPKNHGVHEKNVPKSAHNILADALNSHAARGVNYLIQEYAIAEQVIQKVHAICDDHCDRKK